jgi:methylase of polypeptide subunit release factors
MIENDFVQTPKEITEALLRMESFEGTILEPCCGKGAISEVLKSKGYNVVSSDKNDYGYGSQKDVYEIKEEYDNIVTNPPFSIKPEMVKHLFSITKKKLVLLWFVKCIGACIESKNAIGLKTIYVLNKKINWIETKMGWLFAWYVWEKGYEGDVTIRRIDYVRDKLNEKERNKKE